jgi:hypothetical protein
MRVSAASRVRMRVRMRVSAASRVRMRVRMRVRSVSLFAFGEQLRSTSRKHKPI